MLNIFYRLIILITLGLITYFLPQANVLAAGNDCTITINPQSATQGEMEQRKVLDVTVTTDKLPSKQYQLKYSSPTDAQPVLSQAIDINLNSSTSIQISRDRWRAGNYQIFVYEGIVADQDLPTKSFCSATFKVSDSLTQFCTSSIKEQFITPSTPVHLEITNIKNSDYDIYINGKYYNRVTLGPNILSVPLGTFKGNEPPLDYIVEIKNVCGVFEIDCVGRPAQVQCAPTSFQVHTSSVPPPPPSDTCQFRTFDVQPPWKQIGAPGYITETFTYRTDCQLDSSAGIELYTPRDLLQDSPKPSKKYYFNNQCKELKNTSTPPQEQSCDLNITIPKQLNTNDPLTGKYKLVFSGEAPKLDLTQPYPTAWFDIISLNVSPPKTSPPPAYKPVTPVPQPQGPQGSSAGTSCKPTTGEEGDGGVMTAIGCVPTEPVELIKSLVGFAIRIGGGIALLLMIAGAFQLITSGGNPDNLKKANEQITNAAIGLLFIIFAIMLLRVIGADILGIEQFINK